MFDGLFDVVDGGRERNLPELAIPSSRSDGGTVRALDYRIDGFTHRALIVEVVVDPRVVGVIVGCEDAVLDQWSDVFSAEFVAEAHVVVALVGGEGE